MVEFIAQRGGNGGNTTMTVVSNTHGQLHAINRETDKGVVGAAAGHGEEDEDDEEEEEEIPEEFKMMSVAQQQRSIKVFCCCCLIFNLHRDPFSFV
jgi:hypothetical protein